MNEMKIIRLFLMCIALLVCFQPLLSQPNPFGEPQIVFVNKGSEYRRLENIIKQHTLFSTSINIIGSRPQIFSIVAPDTLMLPESGSQTFEIQVTVADSDGAADVDSVWFYSRNTSKSNSPFSLGNLGNGVWSITLQISSTNRIDTYPFVFFAKDIEGNLSDSVVHNVTLVAHVTSVESQLGDKLQSFELLQNYPNPFNPTTNISFNIPRSSYVSLKVYNLLGKEVAIIFSEKLSAGHYSRQWNASDLSSGVYFYCLQVGSAREIKKLVLLK